MNTLQDDPVTRYKNWSKRSAELHERAQRVLPGGDTRASAYYAPYPLAIDKAVGCRMWDVDEGFPFDRADSVAEPERPIGLMV